MANYLPVLLGSFAAVPDDSVLSDLPCGQVDYLSHEWREEDVWRSWRNMTRLKNEIANGIRLENASWRTWWKQRNGLKTVTPETLNWLKDSDVTWLYGPLHTADQHQAYTPKPSPSTAAALDLPSAPSLTFSQSSGGLVRKPILKHRSITELLTSDFPLSPLFSPPESDDETQCPSLDGDAQDVAMPQGQPSRPSLMHTKSDTHITRWGPNRAFRRDSPPRIIPTGAPSAAEMQSALLQPQNSSDVVPQKRKHISFNTFVEQCIAIDQPQERPSPWGTRNSSRSGARSNTYSGSFVLDDDGYDEDSEDGVVGETEELLFGDEDDLPREYSQHPHARLPSHPHHAPRNTSPPSSSSPSEDDDDDVLEMRVRHIPSSPHLSVARSSSQSSSSSSQSRPPNARVAYRGGWPHGSAQSIVPSPSIDKELVTIALIAPTMLKTKADEEDYPFPHLQAPSHQYPHQPRLSHGKHWEPCSPQDLPVELVYVPPRYIYSDVTDDAGPGLQDQELAYQASLTPRPRFSPHPMTTSPDQQEEAPIHREFADVANTEAKPTSEPVIERAPDFIVSSEEGARDCSRSRSRSRSRTPSPNTITADQPGVAPSISAAVPVPNAATSPSSLLSPPDRGLSRGRSSSSPMLCSQSQSDQPRGRSITRTSSFSDRSSVASGSPFDSPSPESGIGLGIGVCPRDRDREREVRRSGERGRERERVGRSSGSVSGSSPNSSMSPEDQRQPPQPVVTVEPPTPACPTVVPQAPMESSNELRKKSSSLSSSSSSSTVCAASVATTRPPPRLMVDPKPVTQMDFAEAPSVPSPSATYGSPPSPSLVQLMKGDQERISPSRSPPRSPGNSQSSTPTHHARNSSGGSRSPTRRYREDQQGGTLVGRAVEIMSNAGAFLGSFWGAGTQTGVTTP